MKVVKFLLSGSIAAATEYAAFLLLIMVFGAKWVILAQILSFVAGFLVSFSMNRVWVFGSFGDTRKQLVKYSILAAVNLVLSSSALWLVISAFSADPYIAKIIVMALVAMWNYLIFSKLIFIDNK